MPRGSVIALSHGGGPMPILGDPSHKDIVESLKQRVPRILKLDGADKPRAIVVVTAHWTTDRPTISSAATHDLLYDYYGFPQEAYGLKYAAPGAPDVAMDVHDALSKAGLEPRLDETRGWDHGVFIPMMLVHPHADIPIVQLSVLASESPEDHFSMGKALETLRNDNIAIVGSGFASFHNLQVLRAGALSDPAFRRRNDTWSTAVTDALSQADPDTRQSKLAKWRDIEGSYEMHPRGGAEHFLPLLVCAAAGGQGTVGKYADDIWGIDVYSYYWQ